MPANFIWTRKPDLEIENLLNQKELRNKSLKRPVIIGGIFGLLFLFLNYLGFRGGMRGFYLFSQSTGFGSRTLLAGVFGFVFCFGLAYYFQKKGSSFLSDDQYLRCHVCKELAPPNTEKMCHCGGRLEPSEYFTWEE